MQKDPAFEDRVAVTRAGVAAMRSLEGDARSAAIQKLVDDIKTRRGVTLARLRILDEALLPKSVSVQTAVRELTWQLCQSEGLMPSLEEWVGDLREMEGREMETEPAELTDEHVKMAGAILLDARSYLQPFVHDLEDQELDSPVWRSGYLMPPGLVLPEFNDSTVARIAVATGVGRQVEPAGSGPYGARPFNSQRWLLLEEPYNFLMARRD